MVHVDPEAVQDLAKRMDAAVTPHLETAQSTLHDARGLVAGMFTTVTFTLASVHAVAVEFMEQELTTKLQDVQDYRTNLNDTARAWARTEDHNTIGPR